MVAVGLRRRYEVNVPQVAVLGGLAMGTALCSVWAVMAAGWSPGTAVVLATTAVAVAEAALVAGSSAGRLAAVLAAPVLGVLVIVPLTVAGAPVTGGDSQTWRGTVASYAHALPLGLFDSEQWSFVVGLCAVLWLVGFTTGWLAVRERRGVLAALPCWAVLATNVLNAPSLNRVALPETAALGFSLLLVARTNLASLESRWRAERVVALPGTRRRYTRIAFAAVLGVLLAGVIVPPLTTTDWSGKLFPFNFAGNGSGGGGAGLLPGSSRDGRATVRFSPQTEPGGPLVDDPQPVLSYTVDGSETTYLRVVDDTYFDRGNWFPSDASGRPASVKADAGALIPRDRNAADGGVSAAMQPVTARIVADASLSGADSRAIFPGEPDGLSRGGIAYGLAGAGGTLLTVERVDLDQGLGGGSVLVSTGTVSTATAAELSTAGTAYPQWVITQGSLDLHRGSSAQGDAQLDRITTLAQDWTVGTSNPYDQARAIENHLRNSPFTYTLSPPQPPVGTWPITFFLTQSHAGYCQYFASAMGTMLRALGIPARLVSGYGTGTVDDSTASSKSPLHVVTTTDAHVWVEAYFPKYGWITFEPTPSSAFGDYQPISRAGASALPSLAPQTTPSALTSPTPTPSASASSGSSGSVAAVVQDVPAPLFWSVIGVVVGGGLFWAGTAWLLRPSTVGTLWLRFALIARLFGLRRRPAETQAAFAARVSRALPSDATSVFHPSGDAIPRGRRVRILAAESLQTIAALSGKSRFSREGLRPQETVRWRRAWRRLCRLTPLLLWRRTLVRLAGRDL